MNTRLKQHYTEILQRTFSKCMSVEKNRKDSYHMKDRTYRSYKFESAMLQLANIFHKKWCRPNTRYLKYKEKDDAIYRLVSMWHNSISIQKTSRRFSVKVVLYFFLCCIIKKYKTCFRF